jgi:hypothetical protein
MVLFLLSMGLHASEELRSSAGFAFPSVQEAGSARAIALGSTYVGIAEGSSAVLWNPAGLALLCAPEIALHHNAALLGAFQEIAVLGLPLGTNHGLGLSLNYEDNGIFNGRDNSGAVAADYSARAYGVSLGWGIKIPAGFALGLGLKFNRRDLAGTASSAFAGDFGILWSHDPRLSLGIAYTNLGPEVDGRQLAQGFRFGAASYIHKGADYEWLLALSDEALLQGDNSVHFGLEHTLYQFLALRAGYALNVTHFGDSSGLIGWTFGGGVLIRGFSIDYAYVPLPELGSMQRISLTYAFGTCPKASGVARELTKTATAVATPAAKRTVPVTIETALILGDADFKRVVPHGEAELLTRAAQGRLDQALIKMKNVEGGYLRVTGKTDIAGPAFEMREIGGRRANLVRGYLVKNTPPSGVVNVVTAGARTGALAGVFQVLVR